MNKKGNQNQNRKNMENANVEFGIEFGDMNASKFYEIPFTNQDKEKPKNKKC